jgi:uncharacterized membrane protein YqiK
MAEAERRKRLALLAAEQDAMSNATRAKITAEADKDVAKNRTAAKREEAEGIKAMRMAEVEADAARIAAENTRSEATAALELEKVRLAAMPAILAEVVKPAEKIRGININHISGLDRARGEGATSPVSQTIESILDMAVALPAMKKIGDSIGVNLDSVLPEHPRSGLRTGAAIIRPPRCESA